MAAVLLALDGADRGTVRDDADFLADAGVAVTVVTTRPTPPGGPALDPRVDVVVLSVSESDHPLLRAERLVVLRAPRAALRTVRRGVSLGYRVPRLWRPTALAVSGVRVLAGTQERVSQQVHRAFTAKVYGSFRGWLLWRLARRRVLPSLRLEGVDLIVATDPRSIPLAWHLARRHPDVTVTLRLDRRPWLPAASRPGPSAFGAGREPAG